MWDVSGASTMKRAKFLPQLIGSPRVKPPISYPEDFRQVGGTTAGEWGRAGGHRWW